MLGKFPNIERQHFKLWLSSTTVLKQILHSRIINQSQNTLDTIKNKAGLYVSNQSFNDALDILNNYNYVVIAGIPGIGKTTLAQMLVLHYLRNNYEFVDVSLDISDAYTFSAHECPIIYLYDDFLGRTSLAEKLQKNEDHRLVNFIEGIGRNKSSKLILTTREYILNQAKNNYEVLNGPIFDKPQCIVDISLYTRPIKAQILYNHLHFSQLPGEYKAVIVNEKAYLSIIDHRNYNPRIIDLMTDKRQIGDVPPDQYIKMFLENLNDPFKIWEHAFNSQLLETERLLLLVLRTLPDKVLISDMKTALKAHFSSTVHEVEKNITRALTELLGNFIVIDQNKGNEIVSFHNPSVIDFIDNYIDKNPYLYELLGNAICFFEQFQWLCKKITEKNIVAQFEFILLDSLRKGFHSDPCSLIWYQIDQSYPNYLDRKEQNLSEKLAYVASIMKKERLIFFESFFEEEFMKLYSQIHNLNFSNETLFGLAKEVFDMNCIGEVRSDFLITIRELLYKNISFIKDVAILIEFLGFFPEMRQYNDNLQIVKAINNIVDDPPIDDREFLREELYCLESIASKIGNELEFQRETLQEHIDNAQEEYTPDLDSDDDRYRGSSHDSIGNDDLFDMFSTLLK